jgi:hypothetical protein
LTLDRTEVQLGLPVRERQSQNDACPFVAERDIFKRAVILTDRQAGTTARWIWGNVLQRCVVPAGVVFISVSVPLLQRQLDVRTDKIRIVAPMV